MEHAAGRVSKGIIAPYPPGIPVVCPGEVISEEVIARIKDVLQAGGRVDGLNDNWEVNVAG